MKIIKSSYQILSNIDSERILLNIEKAGRTCYKSEDRITEKSAPKFVKMILGKHHDSVIEHEHMSVKFIFDRGISHEMVRHRLASFSQESTRYCNYSKKNENSELNIIDISQYMNEIQFAIWEKGMLFAEKTYNELIEKGCTPQIARSVLPNSLKTEIVVTTNLRHWREIFRQRVAKAAHPQMREVMQPLLDEVKSKLPVIFDDINYE